MLDVELKGTPEHAAVKNNPKKALAAAYNIRKGWKPKKIYYNVVINLGKKLDAFFASHSTSTNSHCQRCPRGLVRSSKRKRHAARPVLKR